METLRGHTSGFAIPTYVIDAPEGGGRVPILPNYLLSMSDSRVVVRNYEGLVTTYAQPRAYQPHNPATCAYCQAHRDEAGQEGVAGLLAGRVSTIAPEGWHALHQRDASAPNFSPQESLGVDESDGTNGKGRSALSGKLVVAWPRPEPARDLHSHEY
jgi:hypothetical protein